MAVPEYKKPRPLWFQPTIWVSALSVAATALAEAAHFIPQNSPMLGYVTSASIIAIAIEQAIVRASRNISDSNVQASKITAESGSSAIAPIAENISSAAQSVQGAAQNVENAAQDVSDIAETVQGAADIATNIAGNYSLDEIIKAAGTAGSRAMYDQLKKDGKI